jgi:hypothetical protein
LQIYTSAAVGHGSRGILPWGTAVGADRSRHVACDGHNVVTHGGRDIPPWATAAGPSAVGHGGSRPADAVPHDARIC